MAARETEHSAGGQAAPGGDFSEYLALPVGWLVPGAAHFLIGERKRGILFAVTIHLLFAAGLFLGGIKAIRPVEQPIWTYTQYLAGWPMLLSTVIQTQLTAAGQLPTAYAPKTQDVGSVYCGIAGMLNLIVLFDALVRVAGAHAHQRVETTEKDNPTSGTGGGK